MDRTPHTDVRLGSVCVLKTRRQQAVTYMYLNIDDLRDCQHVGSASAVGKPKSKGVVGGKGQFTRCSMSTLMLPGQGPPLDLDAEGEPVPLLEAFRSQDMQGVHALSS